MATSTGGRYRSRRRPASVRGDLVPAIISLLTKSDQGRISIQRRGDKPTLVSARVQDGTRDGILSSAGARTWIVFCLSLLCSGLGVLVSLTIFRSTITNAGSRWLISVGIAAAMLSLSYGAKYSHPDSRTQFNPMDALNFFVQGVLWPATWPTLAKYIGIPLIGGPKAP
jgi:hypothetical protein